MSARPADEGDERRHLSEDRVRAGRLKPRRVRFWAQVVAPVNPTVMPAALAARIPTSLSSTTRQRVGSAAIVAAASRNRSGAGLPSLTMVALNRWGAKRSSRPVISSERRIRSG